MSRNTSHGPWLAPAISSALALAVMAGFAGPASADHGPLVEVDWLESNLDNEDVVILDTRGEAYPEGHVPGALHAPYPDGWRTERDGVPGQLPPLEDLEAHIGDLGIGGDETIVIVPEAESASEFGGATRVYWTLKLVGVDDVAILNGGYRAWRSADAPLETTGATAEAVAFSADLRDELLVSSDEVRERLDHGSSIMLDGRPEPQFLGQEKHPAAQLFGRLPGSTHLDQSVFFDPDDGRLLPQQAAAELIPADASDPEAEIVSYCNTGHWASMNWFVMSEVLGYSNVTLFDDSMVGWTESPDNPIESDRTRLDDLRDWWSNITG